MNDLNSSVFFRTSNLWILFPQWRIWCKMIRGYIPLIEKYLFNNLDGMKNGRQERIKKETKQRKDSSFDIHIKSLIRNEYENNKRLLQYFNERWRCWKADISYTSGIKEVDEIIDRYCSVKANWYLENIMKIPKNNIEKKKQLGKLSRVYLKLEKSRQINYLNRKINSIDKEHDIRKLINNLNFDQEDLKEFLNFPNEFLDEFEISKIFDHIKTLFVDSTNEKEIFNKAAIKYLKRKNLLTHRLLSLGSIYKK